MTVNAIAGLIFLFILLVARFPVGLAMFTAGAVGYATIAGSTPLLGFLKTQTYFIFSSYALSVIPLFLLMGNLAAASNLSRNLFDGAYAAIGYKKGGIAVTTIAGCAMFGAICGSSIATAATMGRVAIPEMQRFKYADSLTTATLAAGGTLGILIPPSVMLVIYAVITEQNIAKMFLAALIPGILATAGYIAAIALYTYLYPNAAPAGEKIPKQEKIKRYKKMIPALILFVVVIGGIYSGVFTPVEAAAFGVVGTIIIAIKQKIPLKKWINAIEQTAISVAMIYLILIGADMFNAFLALTQLPQNIAQFIQNTNASPYTVLAAILILYLILGCFMESLSMILLTIPTIFPAIMTLNFGMTPEYTAIWFGILVLVVIEVGLITPPVGLNLFIIAKLVPNVKITQIWKGTIPFLISDLIRIILLVSFPALSVFAVQVFW